MAQDDATHDAYEAFLEETGGAVDALLNAPGWHDRPGEELRPFIRLEHDALAMPLYGDPKFSYRLTAGFHFGLGVGSSSDMLSREDRRGITMRLVRTEPPASGRKNPTHGEVIRYVIPRPDLGRLLSKFGVEI